MTLRDTRRGRRLRTATVALLGMVLVGVVATQGMAAPTDTCFGKPATSPGSLTGTPGNDVIIGTTGNDTIDGLGGNDSICGLAGSDQLMGGLGNDQLDGGEGDDFVRGDVVNFGGTAIGGGNDILYLG